VEAVRGALGRLGHAKSRQQCEMDWEATRNAHKLSTDDAKHAQITSGTSTASAATPSAPLPHGNALVVIEKLK